jgi:hypothetical protein
MIKSPEVDLSLSLLHLFLSLRCTFSKEEERKKNKGEEKRKEKGKEEEKGK